MDALNSPTWNKHKETIQQLYLLNKPPQSAAQVQRELENRGFAVRKSKLNAQLKVWGFKKKLEKKDWPCIEYHMSKRGKQQKRTEVLFNGRVILPATVSKSIGANRYCSSSIAPEGHSPRIPSGVILRTPMASPTIPPRKLESNTSIISTIQSCQFPVLDSSTKIMHSKITPDKSRMMTHDLPVWRGSSDLASIPPKISHVMKTVKVASAGFRTKPLNLPSSKFKVELSALMSRLQTSNSSMSFSIPEFSDPTDHFFGDSTWSTYYSIDNTFLYNNPLDLSLGRPSLLPSTETSVLTAEVAEGLLCRVSNNELGNRFSKDVLEDSLVQLAENQALMRVILGMRGFAAQAIFTRLLETVCRKGWSSDLKLLMRNGIDVSLLAGLKGGRLLQSTLAAHDNSESRSEIVECLLENGASPNLPTSQSQYDVNCSPLLLALLYEHLSAARELLAIGAELGLFEVNDISWCEFQRAIKLAMTLESMETTKLLLEFCMEKFEDIKYFEIYPHLEWASSHSTISRHETLLRSNLARRDQIPFIILKAALDGSAVFESVLNNNKSLVGLQRNEALRKSLCLYMEIADRLICPDPEVTLPMLLNKIDPSIAASRDNKGEVMHHFLCKAAERHLGRCVEILLEAGVEIDLDVFLEACSSGTNIQILKILLQRGVDLELWGWKGLRRALAVWNMPGLKLLVENGADINTPDEFGVLAIEQAMKNQNLKAVLYLIEKGANLKQSRRVEQTWSILHFAAALGDLSVFKLVLEAGGSIIPDLMGPATLFDACFYHYPSYGSKEWRIATGRLQIFDLLIQKKASTVKDARWRGEWDECKHGALTALIGRNAKMSLIFRFIEAGADVNETGPGGPWRTPLMAAFARGDLKIITYLLDRGAGIDIFHSERYSRTALQDACEDSNFDAVKFLLARGADVNAKPAKYRGTTALQGAAIRGSIEIATLLLEFGAEVNAESAEEDGRMALDGAAECGHLNMVQFLLDGGANSGRKGGISGFDEAIRLAKRERHWAIADLISSYHETQDVVETAAFGRDVPHAIVGVNPAVDRVMNDESSGHILFLDLEETDTGMVW